MRRIIPIIVIISLTIALAVSCGYRSNRYLEKAGQLMEEYPDSSLAILQSVDTTELRSEYDKAQYALLLTEAEYKNYIDTDNDSLISTACEYFANHHNSYELMKSLFYKASKAYIKRDYKNSIRSLLSSEKIAKERDDIYWQAKIYELMEIVFSATCNFEQSSKYSLKASRLFESVGKINQSRYTLVDHAISEGNIGNVDYSINILDSLYGIAANEDNLGLRKYCISAKFPLLVDAGRYKEAKILYYGLPAEETTKLYTAIDLSRVAKILMNEGDLQNSFIVLQNAENIQKTGSDTMSMYHGWRDYYWLKKDYKRAMEYSDSLISGMAKSEVDFLVQSAIGIQGDHYSDLYDSASKRIKLHRILGTCIIFLFILLIFAIIIFSRYMIQKKSLKLEHLGNDIRDLGRDLYKLKQQEQSNLNELNELKKVLKNSEDRDKLHLEKVKELESSLSLSKEKEMSLTNENIILLEKRIELFSSQWKIIDSLCERYYENSNVRDENFANRKLLEHVIETINEMKQNEFIRKIEESINSYNDNMIIKIRELCPLKRKQEYDLLILMLAGFSSRSICLLCKINLKLYYSKRARWINAISKKVAMIYPEVETSFMKLI